MLDKVGRLGGFDIINAWMRFVDGVLLDLSAFCIVLEL